MSLKGVVGAAASSSSGTSVTPKGEIPSGTVNGVNATFTLTATPLSGSLLLQVNGQVQLPTTAYALSGSTITFQAGFIPETGDLLYANYAS